MPVDLKAQEVKKIFGKSQFVELFQVADSYVTRAKYVEMAPLQQQRAMISRCQATRRFVVKWRSVETTGNGSKVAADLHNFLQQGQLLVGGLQIIEKLMPSLTLDLEHLKRIGRFVDGDLSFKVQVLLQQVALAGVILPFRALPHCKNKNKHKKKQRKKWMMNRNSQKVDDGVTSQRPPKGYGQKTTDLVVF